MSDFFATRQDLAQAELDAELDEGPEAPERTLRESLRESDRALREYWRNPFERLDQDALWGLDATVGIGVAETGSKIDRTFQTYARGGGTADIILETPRYTAGRDQPSPFGRYMQERRAFHLENLRRHTVDPNSRSEAANLIGGLTRLLVGAGAATAAGGPAGIVTGPVLTGTGFGEERTEALLEEGVDPETAEQAGMIEGTLMAAMVAAPVALPGKLWMRAASGAGINLGFGFGLRGSMHSYLESQGYPELAARYQWFDPHAMTIDAAFGAVFGKQA